MKKGIIRNLVAAAAIIPVLAVIFTWAKNRDHEQERESTAVVTKFINAHARGNIQISLQRPDGGARVQMGSEYSNLVTATEPCKLHIHTITSNYRINYPEASPTLHKIGECTVGLHELPYASMSVSTTTPGDAAAERGNNSEDAQGPSRSYLKIFDAEHVDCWGDETMGSEPVAALGGGQHGQGFRLIFTTRAEAATAARILKEAVDSCR